MRRVSMHQSKLFRKKNSKKQESAEDALRALVSSNPPPAQVVPAIDVPKSITYPVKRPTNLKAQHSSGSLRLFPSSPASTSGVSTQVAGQSSETVPTTSTVSSSPSRSTMRSRTASAGSVRAPWRAMPVSRPAPSIAVSTAASIFSNDAEVGTGGDNDLSSAQTFLQQSLDADAVARGQEAPVLETLEERETVVPPAMESSLGQSVETLPSLSLEALPLDASTPPPAAVLDMPFPSTVASEALSASALGESVVQDLLKETQAEPAVQPAPIVESSSSWFGSLSRAAGLRQKEAMVQRQTELVESRTKDVVAPVLADEIMSSQPDAQATIKQTSRPISPPAVGLAQFLEDNGSPSLTVQPPTPKLESSSPSSTSVPIPSKNVTKRRSWFSSSRRIASPLASPGAPSTLHSSRAASSGTGYPVAPGSLALNASTSSIPSSIDEEVPPPLEFAVEVDQRPEVHSVLSGSGVSFPSSSSTISGSSGDSGLLTPSTPGPRARLSSITSPSPPPSSLSTSMLNPSTSRFTLSIPLLGQAKLPLDRAAAQATVTGSLRASASTLSSILTTPLLAPPPLSGPTPFVVQAAAYSTSGLLPREGSIKLSNVRSDAEMPPIPAQILDERNVPPAQRDGSDNVPEVERPSVDLQPGTSSAPLANDGSWWGYVGWTAPANPEETKAESSNTEAPSGSTTTIHAEATNDSVSAPAVSIDTPARDAQPEPTANKAISVHSAATQSSTWYSPWAWYGPTEAPPVPELPAATENKDGLTEAEVVKEEALARDEPEQSPPEPERNPIQGNLAANASSWSAFFASRSVAKTIAEKAQSISGMEVMHIPDDVSGADGPGGGGDGKKGKKEKTPVDVQKKVEPEPTGDKPTAAPLTNSETIKAKNEKANTERKDGDASKKASTSAKKQPPSALNLNEKEGAVAGGKKSADSDKKSGASTLTSSGKPPAPPNLVLPTWGDTFLTAPRSLVPIQAVDSSSKFSKTIRFVSKVLLEGGHEDAKGKPKETEWERRHRERLEEEYMYYGQELPRAWDIIRASEAAAANEKMAATSAWEGWGGSTRTKGKAKATTSKHVEDTLQGAQRVVILGVHGWFPGNLISRVVGEPTGTSPKFVAMMTQALEEFQSKHGVELKKITGIPLEGEGTIDKRVNKLYDALTSNKEWMSDLHDADVVFVATHSQGSIVSTHLLDRLIRDKHLRTRTNITPDQLAPMGSAVSAVRPPQRVCCLALCGIHHGPLRYLSNNSVVQPYLQYFESAAALELFEFQNTDSAVAKMYVTALKNVVDNGTKMVYVASLNDQVVPIYSGTFASASHPLILRALYIDGDAYHSSDFLSNLIVLLIRIRNAGLSDSGLLTHLSEATAGSLNGVGHSTAYEDVASYTLAVNYLFLTNDGTEAHPELCVEQFNASTEQNDYEIPWSLRDVIADESVKYFFQQEINELRDAFREWHPKTTILRDLKRKLQPIQKLPSTVRGRPAMSSNSKL